MKRVFLILLALLMLWSGFAMAQTAEQDNDAIQKAVETFLSTAITQIAANDQNPWIAFICGQGAENVQMNLEKFDVTKGRPLAVTFALAGAQPRVKTLPKYEGEPEAFLKAAAKNMHAHDVTAKTSLLITAKGGGYEAAFAPKADAALAKTVKGIATNAQKAFTDKTLFTAITDFLMPCPIATPKKAPAELAAADFRPTFQAYLKRNSLDVSATPEIPWLLYGLKGFKLDVTGGPENFRVTFAAPDLGALIPASGKTLAHDLNYDPKAKSYTNDQQRDLLLERAAQDAIAFRHDKKNTGVASAYTFSFLNLPGKVNPEADFYGEKQEKTVEAIATSALVDLQMEILLMPDYPALPNPKTGVVRGESTGTSCTFKTPKDGYNRCIIAYKPGTTNEVCMLFVEGGKTGTMKLPEGRYDLIFATGSYWYGEDALFGEYASYELYSNDDVPSRRYIHQFFLGGVKAPSRAESFETEGMDYEGLAK